MVPQGTRDTPENVVLVTDEIFYIWAEALLDWRCGSFRAFQFRERNEIPFKVQAPVEPSTDNWGRAVGKCVCTDDVNDRANHSAAGFPDGRQQRLEPQLIHFTVAVQEHKYLPWEGKSMSGMGNSEQQEDFQSSTVSQDAFKGVSSKYFLLPSSFGESLEKCDHNNF